MLREALDSEFLTPMIFFVLSEIEKIEWCVLQPSQVHSVTVVLELNISSYFHRLGEVDLPKRKKRQGR